MSKIGKKPILIPGSVQLDLGKKVSAKGPLGELSVKVPEGIKVEQKEGQIVVSALKEDRRTKAFHGLVRSLIANMVIGVSQGFSKKLELSGIGFRANLAGQKLVLNVGYSHQVEIDPPEGIEFKVADNKITVEGKEKELVGRIASQIRKVRPPDAYKGKGIRYEGEKITLKPGKAAKTGAA